MRALHLEDVDSIHEDANNGAPVVRIASLVDGGVYFARPTEVPYERWHSRYRTRIVALQYE